MNIGTSQDVPSTGNEAVDKVRQLQQQGNSSSGLSEKQRLQAKKVSQDFEALFVGMMLKSMRSTVTEDKLTGGGKGEEVFRSLLDQEYANAAAKRGGIGLAKMIEKEIVRLESRTNAKKIDRSE